MLNLDKGQQAILAKLCLVQAMEVARFREASYNSHIDRYKKGPRNYIAEVHVMFWDTLIHRPLIQTTNYIPQQGVNTVIDNILNTLGNLRNHVYMAHRVSIPLTLIPFPNTEIHGLYNVFYTSYGIKESQFHRLEVNGTLSAYPEGMSYGFPPDISLMSAALINSIHTN